MKLFNIDQHISVIADLKDIFGMLGHTIVDKCLSGHHWVMGREKDSIPMLDGDNWCGFQERKLWNEFYDTYAKDLEQYDAFICCYPPIFAMLYQRFNKPIIIDIPIRYEYPCQSSEKDWNQFNDFLCSRNKLYLVANNRYDEKYTENFLGESGPLVEYIPSLCEYTGEKYNPSSSECIYYSACPFEELEGSHIKWKHSRLKPGYTWKELFSFKAIVHFPYNVSTMSIFEQYSAGVPIFVPSKRFALELYKNPKYRMFEQVSWASTFGRPAGSVIKGDNEHDPNDFTNLEAMSYWLDYADFYNEEEFPFIIKFDSFDELKGLTRGNLFPVSALMQKRQDFRRERIIAAWDRLLKGVASDIGM